MHTRLRDKKPSRQTGLARTLYWTGAGLVLVFAILYGSLWLFVNDPLDWEPPRDSDLIALFSHQKSVFERIVTMGQEDGEPGWSLSADFAQHTLLAERAKSYQNLISKLGSCVKVYWDHNSGGVNFIFRTGGTLLAVGAEWFKGIAYIPNPQRGDGKLIQSLDGVKRLKTGIYLRQIDKNWFLLYERTE